MILSALIYIGTYIKFNVSETNNIILGTHINFILTVPGLFEVVNKCHFIEYAGSQDYADRKWKPKNAMWKDCV